jgi:hypothetical protein
MPIKSTTEINPSPHIRSPTEMNPVAILENKLMNCPVDYERIVNHPLQ